MIKKSFLFNINKCVGCHACVVACSIENKTSTEIQWREISSFNPCGYPDIPLFHFSMACNHCKDAPCLTNCPALAYSSDKNTGAIIHHAEKCMGCKYCTWACPYDAPKFNPKKGIVEKCTFCNHLIGSGLKPSCASLCPTGALGFIDYTENTDQQAIPGFTDEGIDPSIKIVPALKTKPKLICSEQQIVIEPNIIKKEKSKIKLRNEWPLVVFTLIAMLLVSGFTAAFFRTTSLNIPLFIISSGIAFLLSLLHLGKKIRAWRSMLNLKNSWLSREIFFFSLFFILSILYLIYYPNMILAEAAIVCGVISLFSIDKVYQVAIQAIKLEIHSAHALLGFFLFTALLLGNYSAFIIVLLIKSGLYIYRKFEMNKQKKNIRLLLSGLRLDMIISFPLLFWFFGTENLQWWVFGSVFIGEIIDRAEYYVELDIITPEKQIGIDLGN